MFKNQRDTALKTAPGWTEQICSKYCLHPCHYDDCLERDAYYERKAEERRRRLAPRKLLQLSILHWKLTLSIARRS